MIIALGTDHAGFELKETVKKFLEDSGYEVKDFGAYEYESTDNYPDFINPTAQFVSENDAMGIIFGGSGQGEAMAANRYKNVRAALCYNQKSAKLARSHNNANVITLGSRLTKKNIAIKCINIFLNTKFNGGRHTKRINKI